MNRSNKQNIQIVFSPAWDGKPVCEMMFLTYSYISRHDEIAHLFMDENACRSIGNLLLQAAETMKGGDAHPDDIDYDRAIRPKAG